MTTYSLLFISENESIDASKRIECSTDEQATEMAAHEVGDYMAIQVWDGDRSISLIGNPRNTRGG